MGKWEKMELTFTQFPLQNSSTPSAEVSRKLRVWMRWWESIIQCHDEGRNWE